MILSLSPSLALPLLVRFGVIEAEDRLYKEWKIAARMDDHRASERASRSDTKGTESIWPLLSGNEAGFFAPLMGHAPQGTLEEDAARLHCLCLVGEARRVGERSGEV